MITVLVVFFDKTILTCIEIEPSSKRSSGSVLDEYAQKYTVERNKLSGTWSCVINSEEFSKENMR